MRGWVGVVLTVAALCGCRPVDVYQCSTDDNCGEGRCEATGFCSFPDSACASGNRYGAFAGEGLGGQCVDGEGGTDLGSSSSSTVTSTNPTSTSTDPTLEPSSSSTSMTTVPISGTETDAESSGDPPGGTGQRVVIDLDTSEIDADYADFVLPIRLAESGLDLSLAGTDGDGLRFYDDDAPIPHEIETWADDAALVWVKVPVLEMGSAQIEVRVGERNPARSLPTTDVWTDYALVYHMNDEVIADGDPVRDASGFAFDGDATGLGDQQVEGLFGPAFRFEGSGQITVGSPPELEANPGAALSIEVWFQRSANGGTGYLLQHEACCLGYAMQAVGGGGPFLRSRLGVGCCTPDICCGADDINYRVVDANLPLEGDDPSWHGAVTTLDRAEGMLVTAYLDGTLRDTETVPDDPDPTFGQLFIGSNGENESFPGSVDELRISNRSRSEAWVQFQYEVMSGQRITYGPPEPLP